MGDMFDNDNYCSKSARACQLLDVMLGLMGKFIDFQKP